jgi:hypothetical protein
MMRKQQDWREGTWRWPLVWTGFALAFMGVVVWYAK